MNISIRFTRHCWLRFINFHRLSSSFTSLGLDETLISSLKSMNITRPTSIQQASFELIHGKSNVVINSETGSGKTLSYAIPIIQGLIDQRKNNQMQNLNKTLVLVPTLELSYQVHNIFNQLLKPHDMRSALVLPNVTLRKTPNTGVLIGTAEGLTQYKVLHFSDVSSIIFDEADKILPGTMDRLNQLFWFLDHFSNRKSSPWYRNNKDRYTKSNNKVAFRSSKIGGMIPPRDINETQFVIVGATLAEGAELATIRRWCPKLHRLRSDVAHRVSQAVDVSFHQVHDSNKFKEMVQCLHQYTEELGKKNLKVLVFLNTKKRAKELFHAATNSPWSKPDIEAALCEENSDAYTLTMMKKFYGLWNGKVLALHNEMKPEERISILQQCDSNTEGFILIATDAISRGIDIPNIDLVIQYDFPVNLITFLHRTGRTGRMGSKGAVVSFVEDLSDPLLEHLRGCIERNMSIEMLFDTNVKELDKLMMSERS